MNRILVGVDGSSYACKALDLAITSAKALDAELLAVHVIPSEAIPEHLLELAGLKDVDEDDTGYGWRKMSMLDEKIVKETERILEEKGVSKSKVLVLKGDPAENIVYAANQHHVQMIFIGNRGLSVAEHMLMGSVAHKVANLSRCTCVIVK